MPEPRPAMRIVLLLIVFPLWGCGNGEPRAGEPADPALDLLETGEPAGPRPVFERAFLFSSASPDSAVYVPWIFRSTVHPGGMVRNRTAWLGRGGSWELLVREEEPSASSRTPWRITPGRTIRLVAGQDDGMESLLFRDPPREMEMRLQGLLTEWTGPQGETVRLHRGTTVFPSGEVPGFVVDYSRNWEEPGEMSGDWGFIHGGDRFQFFLEEVIPIRDPRTSGRYQGWSRTALRDSRWPVLTVEWLELRSFERARRDIPARWRVSSPGGDVEGELESVASHLTALPGEGPILPVSALFEVTGTIRVEGETFTVTGVIRHVQR